jgi:hypothetical protein
MDVATTTKCELLARDMIRHERDQRLRLAEGLGSEYRDQVFLNSFALTTPIALKCLTGINEILFDGAATVRAVEPHDDGDGGLIGTWEITWPALEESVIENDGTPYPPCRLAAILPITATRGHLAFIHPQKLTNDEGATKVFGPNVLCCWPFQVTSQEDANHLEPLIWTIVLGHIHETTVRSSARFGVFPEYETPDTWGHASKEPVVPI